MDSLRGSEFARLVLASSRTATPSVPAPQLRLDPPTSPISSKTAPVLPALDTSAACIPAKLKFNLLPAVAELDTQPVTPEATSSVTPPFVQPESYRSHAPVSAGASSSQQSSLWTPRAPRRVSPIPPALASPVSPPLAGVGRHGLSGSPIAPHPNVDEMASFSEPHPLNILADISSAAPKSPVDAPTACSLPSLRKPISKTHSSPAKRSRKTPGSGSVGSVSASGSMHASSTSFAGGTEQLVQVRLPASTLVHLPPPVAHSAPAAGTCLSAERGSSPVRRVTKPAAASSVVKPKQGPGGKRVFECLQCSKQFSERFNLNKHVRAVHELRRPFECMTCHARFQQRDHMKKHETCVHKKVRQFECEICHSAFGWRGVLKKHRKSVHGKQD